MPRRLASSLLLALTLLTGTTAHAAVFHPQGYELANGLRVVVVPGALSHTLAQMVWYKTGAADDPAGKSGLAHYLEHLMFRGSASGFSAAIAAQGGQDNAFTERDATAFYVSIDADDLPAVMQLEATRMRDLRFSDEEAAKELAVVQSERGQRTGNDPKGLFEDGLDRALFPHHPYGRPIIGLPEDIAKLTPQDARDAYAAHYAPNNAILVVSGDVTPQRVLALAAATFGRLPAAPAAPRVALNAPDKPERDRVELADPRIKQPTLVRRILAANDFQDERRARALEVLAEALAGGQVGLLYRDLVVEKGLAAALDAMYNPQVRGPAYFSLAAIPTPGTSAKDLESAMDASLLHLAQKGLSEKDVAGAKKRLEDLAAFARDRVMAPAETLGGALAAGEDIQDVEDWPARIRAVRPREVNEALRALLNEPRQVRGLLRPLEQSEGREKNKEDDS